MRTKPRSVLAVGSLFLSLHFSACVINGPGEGDPGGTECTEEARASVTISVVDEEGEALRGASVTFSVDGGDVRSAECVDGSEPEYCARFVAGWEEAGEFVIWVEKDGYLSRTYELTVEMTDDGCHVQSRDLTAALEVDPDYGVCTADAAASVIVNVVDEEGEPLEGATVLWSVDGGETQEALCAESSGDDETSEAEDGDDDGGDADPCSTYITTWEVEGTFEISAELEGYVSASTTVDVGLTEDGCHVDTETVDLVLVEDDACASADPAPSFVLTVVDEHDETLPDASVSYSVNDGAFISAACWSMNDEGECIAFAAFDVPGDYVIKVTHDGYQTGLLEVDVEGSEDGCGVETLDLEIALEPEPFVCTEEIVPSVLISLVDESGEAITDAGVRYSIDGSAFREASCSESAEAGGCLVFMAGSDEPGEFLIIAQREGYIDAIETLDVGMDEYGCHVVTQELVLTMSPQEVACTEEVRPSVIVNIVDQEGEPLEGASVTYSANGEAFAEAECQSSEGGSCTSFVAGYEIAGDFVIRAEYDGLDPVIETVVVEQTDDGCHVVTETVDLRFDLSAL